MSAQAKSSLMQKYRTLPKKIRILIGLFIVYLLFTATLGLLVPYIAKDQIPKQLSSLIQRPVTLGDVKINPFTLKLEVSKFYIEEKNQKKFTGFEQLSARFDFWQSLINRAYTVSQVKWLQPTIAIERLASSPKAEFNFSDILSTLANRKTNATEKPSDAPQVIPHFIINQFAIIDADLRFQDRVTQGQLHYPEINLNIKHFDSQNTLTAKGAIDANKTANSNHFHIELLGSKGGAIVTQGELQLSPLNLTGDIKITQISLPQFWSFIADKFNVKLSSGTLDIQSHFALATQDQQPHFSTSKGKIAVNDLRITRQDQEAAQAPTTASSKNTAPENTAASKVSKAPLLSLSSLSLDDIRLDLDKKTLNLGTLKSDALTAKAVLDNNGLDLASLLLPKPSTKASQPPKKENNQPADNTDSDKPTAPQAATTSANTQASPWLVTLAGISLSNNEIALTENKVAKNKLWKISPFNLSTGPLTSTLADPIRYQLDLVINQHGKLTAQGSINANTQQLETELNIEKFDLSDLQDYISPYINVELQQGLFSTNAKMTANKEGQLTYQGTASINGLSLSDKVHKTSLLKWEQLDVSRIDFDKTANLLSIDELAFNQLYSRLIIAKDKTTNFGDLLVNNSSGAKKAKSVIPTTKDKQAKGSKINAKPSQPLAISINKVTLKDSATFFADNSLIPNFAASIEQLNGEITKLSSTGKHAAKVDINGKVDRYAPVTVKGEINPLLKKPYLDLDVAFKNVELTSVNPYSGTYAGYYIDKGQLSLDLKYHLKDNQLDGSNHAVINQLQLGKPSKSDLATSLPVTLAIALLQDRHGVIDLGVQVSGDLDEPDFSFGSIIMTAITNIITKAVTAPFSLLGSLFDSEDELDKVNFAPGEFILSDSAKKALDTLAKALKERPKLKLNIEGAVKKTEDEPALAAIQLHNRLATAASMPIEQLPTNLTASSFPTTGPLADALIALYETSLNKPAAEVKRTIAAEHQGDAALSDEALTRRWYIALYNFTLKEQTLTNETLGDLAQARGKVVKAYLVEHAQVEPMRIFLLDSKVNTKDVATQALLTLDAD